MKAIWAAALAAMAGCGAGRSVCVVDRVERGRATLVDDAGQQRQEAVADLPAGAVEGAVLVDGQLDDRERERLKAEIAGLRRRLAAGSAGSFSLEAP